MVELKRVGLLSLFLLILFSSLSLPFVSAAVGDVCSSQADCDVGEVCKVPGPGQQGVCEVAPNGGASASGESDFGGSGFDFLSFLKLEERWNLWVKGSSQVGATDMGLLAETVKFMVLFIVIFVVFSALGAMEFPKAAFPRFLLSVVVGFLGTFMITTQELLTALVSYGALTTTILIAVPMIVLLGITVMAAYKANSIGLYMSKVLWAIFAVFLIFKALVLLAMFQHFIVSVQYDADGNVASFEAQRINEAKKLPSYLLPIIPVKFEGTSKKVDLDAVAKIMGKADYGMAWILLFTGLAVFFFMVINGKWITHWLMKEAKESAIEAAKNNIQLSAARDKLQADAMRDVAKTS